MKKLLLTSILLIATTTARIYAEEESCHDLINECAKGNTEACSRVIHGNSRLNEIDQKLEEDNWLEKEKLGVSLLPLYLECKKGKKRSCTKFVKQVKRLKLYNKN